MTQKLEVEAASSEWLREMAEAESTYASFSVGGLAGRLGLLTTAPSAPQIDVAATSAILEPLAELGRSLAESSHAAAEEQEHLEILRRHAEALSRQTEELQRRLRQEELMRRMQWLETSLASHDRSIPRMSVAAILVSAGMLALSLVPTIQAAMVLVGLAQEAAWMVASAAGLLVGGVVSTLTLMLHATAPQARLGRYAGWVAVGIVLALTIVVASTSLRDRISLSVVAISTAMVVSVVILQRTYAALFRDDYRRWLDQGDQMRRFASLESDDISIVPFPAHHASTGYVSADIRGGASVKEQAVEAVLRGYRDQVQRMRGKAANPARDAAR